MRRRPSPGRIDVCLSVDVEFTPNNALACPERPPLGDDWVYGTAGGRSQGLGFLLGCLRRYGLKGTFFTEVFNTYYFTDAPMARVAADILADGHDVQLHLHPVWRRFLNPRWRDEPVLPPLGSDSFVNREPAEVAKLLLDGCDILGRLGAKRPIAFRCGNLDAGGVIYQGMREAGLKLASNVGLALHRPAEAALCRYAGLCTFSGIVEVPVTSYRLPLLKRRLSLLSITGSSFAEMRRVLTVASHKGVGPIVVLMHPHDFHIPLTDGVSARPRYVPDRLRQRRLEQLCRFVTANRSRFRVTTFADSVGRWTALAARQASDGDPVMTSSLRGLVLRTIENKVRPVMLRLPQ